MKPIDYSPETPDLLRQLGRVSSKRVQEYLQICYELGQSIPARDILHQPYDLQVNPYAVLLHWLELAEYELGGQVINSADCEQLREYAALPARELRQPVDDQVPNSTQIQQKFAHPYLQHFSQLYAVNEILNSLHVYNFFLQNYVLESARARWAIEQDHRSLWRHPLHFCGALWQEDHRTGHQYNQWVRDTFVKSAITKGSAHYSKLISYINGTSYEHFHPVANHQQIGQLLETYEDNLDLSKKLRYFRRYRWIAPTSAEADLVTEISTAPSYIAENSFLLSRGVDYLIHASKLAGQINHRALEV